MGATSSPSCTESNRAFNRVRDAFVQACHAGVTAETSYVLVGQRARLRIAGTTLARYVDAPFAHLRVSEPDRVPDLTIELWDAGATGVAGPGHAAAHERGQRWVLDDGELAVSADGSIVSHATRTTTMWLNRRERRIVGWVTAADALPLYDRARPLQILLALCASDCGIHAVHGALVARAQRGVLLAGDSGAGKSTAALSCLEAGFAYLGDDWVGVCRGDSDGTMIGHSLYSSISLEPAQVTRFPQLQRHAVAPRSGADLKSLILLAELYPRQFRPTARIGALVLPCVTDGVDTSVRPAAKKDALLTMTRSAVCTMRPRGGRAVIATLTQLAREQPAYWLDIGRDLHQIPRRIDEILAATAT